MSNGQALVLAVVAVVVWIAGILIAVDAPDPDSEKQEGE